jgi:RNA polymerase sigma factor (sigma-70 family)
MPANLDDLLRAFREGRGDQVWPEFLDQCGGLLLQVARSVERDEDEAADAFVYICEQLAAGRFARLSRFDPAGSAQPVTWLRAVARNLGLDHHRRRHGRFRIFGAVARLSALDQGVFRRRHRDRLSLAETLAALRPQWPRLTLEAVTAADQRVNLALTSRQQWSLAAARPRFEPLLTIDETEGVPVFEPESSDPSPEALLGSVERRTRLRDALGTLSAEDRMLVRLRIEQDLTLSEIAQVAGLSGPQQADRRLRAIYLSLRERLGQD